MAINQVTVPYLRGYDFGIGADLASGSPMAKVVEGAVSPVENAGGATVDFQIQRITTTSELETALGIDVEASYGCAAFGAGVSARFGFAKQSKVQSSSLFMSITATLELGFLQIDDPTLSSHAGEMVGRPDIFTSRYGNMFVRGIARGGLFVGVLRVDTGSAEESETIAAELEGSYGLFSGEAETKFKSVQRKYRNEVFVRMYHEGGPIDLKINNPADPMELLANANRFLESFQTQPDAVARPYAVTLAPMAVARGPLPPNAADLQKAQDVLMMCAKKRSALLDQLNLLEFLHDNPSKFDFSNGADLSTIKAAIQNGQLDLDLVAECASAAINRPETAKVPTLFAQDNGTSFPRLTMPDPLPAPKAATRIVEVPDFATCSSWQACTELATSSGLVAKEQVAALEPADFSVLSFTPPKGTPVPEASEVTIVTHPVKVVLDLIYQDQLRVTPGIYVRQR